MQTYKILILHTNFREVGKLKEQTKKTKQFLENLPEHKDKHVFDFDFKKISIKDKDLVHKMYKETLQSNGNTLKTYGLEDTKSILRKNISRGKYNAVIFAYDIKKTKAYPVHKKKDSYIASWCKWEPFYPETEHIEMAWNSKSDSVMWKTILHELHHAFGNKVERFIKDRPAFIDQMDKTLVNGVWEAYYKNAYPTAKDGNYAVTRANYAPYWQHIMSMPDWITRLKQDVITYFYFNNQPKYKYFKESEVIGLKDSFVKSLDTARGVAGIAFVITSGYRTPEHNKKVGGSPTSSHLRGEAVDLRCRNDKERYAIVKGIIEAGLGCVVYTKSGHVHIDTTKRITVLDK